MSAAGRFIPAHPRSRGEHSHILEPQAFNSGSSPLARGTLVGIGALAAGFRLIPARAGNTYQGAVA